MRYQQESREFAERERENHRLQVELRAVQSRNAMLEGKLARYDRDAKYLQSQEDHLKKREREMVAQVAAKDQKLRAVKEIFERTAMASIQPYTPRSRNQETPGSSVATTSGANSRAVYTGGNRTRLYPQLPVFTATSVRSAATGERRRAPSPPPKPSSYRNGGGTPMGTRTLRANQTNGRGNNHRRSKSVDAETYEARALNAIKSVDEENSDNSSGQKRKSDEVEDEGNHLSGTRAADGQAVQGILKKSKF